MADKRYQYHRDPAIRRGKYPFWAVEHKAAHKPYVEFRATILELDYSSKVLIPGLHECSEGDWLVILVFCPCQCMSCVPGLSRVTITATWLCHVSVGDDRYQYNRDPSIRPVTINICLVEHRAARQTLEVTATMLELYASRVLNLNSTTRLAG